MKCQLINSRRKVINVATEVLEYISELKSAGDPPVGVPGKRIAKCVRSEIDREWKERIDKIIAPKKAKLQKKADELIEEDMKPFFAHRDQALARIDAYLKREEGTHDAPWQMRAAVVRESMIIRRWEARNGRKFPWPRRAKAKLDEYWRVRRLKEQQRRYEIMGRAKRDLADMIREEGEKISAKHRGWVAEKIEQIRQRLMEESGPHEWRLSFALDTYGGKAYRGCAKLEAKRLGKWSMEKEKAT